MQVLNWEGRIWVEEWKDFKWLNLRATPRRIPGGTTQWVGFMTNITQSMKEKLEVIESREKLAKISIQLDYVKEEERKRISREIHDDIGGSLTAIKIGINGLQLKLEDHQKVLKDKALYLLSIVDATFEAVHKIVSDLRPNILELGIVEALSWQTKEFEKRMDITCHFSTNKQEITLDSNHEVALYRICQEAFSNISKYAQAKHVSVKLNCLPEHIMMQIEDDGLGMQPSERFKENSFGIKGMSERVVALDGDFSIDSDPKKGTTITMKLPMQRFNDNAVLNAEDKVH
jgi:signal transduction histidine kinase